ncbi:hypothetical protein K461DRAFT_300558 [Myriangium duriaei CBS 260.36]|uniref:Uncharacterized protein n=1 Tax=Myriangium duriaei CBS 260.36 TaxID=1168546 RepID=A0A9P4IWI7_9PEZI|nr:hypothetical protein K461DRAFT_300558 [Myriangium duriaei CBS 260.36]
MPQLAIADCSAHLHPRTLLQEDLHFMVCNDTNVCITAVPTRAPPSWHLLALSSTDLPRLQDTDRNSQKDQGNFYTDHRFLADPYFEPYSYHYYESGSRQSPNFVPHKAPNTTACVSTTGAWKIPRHSRRDDPGNFAIIATDESASRDDVLENSLCIC